MFTPKQLLVNCATLLCLENRPGVSTSSSHELVSRVIAALPIPENAMDHDHGRQTFLELRATILWLNGRSEETFPNDQEVLQHVQVACREETYLYEAILNPLMERYDGEKAVVRMIQSYRNNLNRYLTDEKIKSLFKEYHHRLVFKPNESDIIDTVRELGEKLEPLVESRGAESHPALMGGADFGNVDEMTKQFDAVKTATSPEGAMRFGWKALNRALGKVGAIKRGEFLLVGGLPHMFKSGFMLSIFVHLCLFNKPNLRDKTRKPLIYFITFENELHDNILTVYRYLKENETGEAVVDSDINIDEASAYVGERLRATGFEVRMDRFDPTEFTYSSLIGILDGLIAEGYEIHALLIDYINMMSKQGIEAKIHGDDIRLLVRRLRNYTAPRGIALASPHQLSSEAMQLTRDNVEDFVKVIAGKGYYDGCKRLGQEPDIELFIHKIEINGRSYLTVCRGKHRNAVTPMIDQYFVLPFQDVGTIPWDVDRDDEITINMNGNVGGSGGGDPEDAWWSM